MSHAAVTGFVPQPPGLPELVLERTSQSKFFTVLFVSALMLGILIQAAGPAWLKNIFRPDQLEVFQKAGILLLAIAVSVVLHELGHLIPSLGFGFHVSRIVFGPLCGTRVDGRWKLQYSRAWFSGSVSAIPCDDNAWRRRMLVVVASGPVASLILFMLAAFLVNIPGESTLTVAFFRALAEINLFICLLGLVPNSADAKMRNDARLFLTLLQNGPEAEQIKLHHLITQLQIAGVRPGLYPTHLIARLASVTGNTDLLLFSAHTIYLWALDSQDMTTADAWDEYSNALIQRQSNLRLSNTVLAESACFDLLVRKDQRSALKKLQGANFETLSPWLCNRAKAALQIAVQNRADALFQVQQARAAARRSQPYFEFESTLLRLLEQTAATIATGDHCRSMHAAA